MLAEPAFFIRPSAIDTLGQQFVPNGIFSRICVLAQWPIFGCWKKYGEIGFPNQFIAREGEAPAEPRRFQLGRSLALPLTPYLQIRVDGTWNVPTTLFLVLTERFRDASCVYYLGSVTFTSWAHPAGVPHRMHHRGSLLPRVTLLPLS